MNKTELNTFVIEIRTELQQAASPEVKMNLERYFKGVLPFHGLRAPEVQHIFREKWPQLKLLDPEERKELAFALLAQECGEEKQFGVLILHKSLKKLDPTKLLSELKAVIDHHVHDWSTSDGLSGRVIRFLIPLDKNVVSTLISWKDAPNLWRQRAAAVSFVWHARHGEYNHEILKICERTVQNPERFVQLGTGWVLRELSLTDLEGVINFIQQHYHFFSREGLRYAIEKMPLEKAKNLLKQRWYVSQDIDNMR